MHAEVLVDKDCMQKRPLADLRERFRATPLCPGAPRRQGMHTEVAVGKGCMRNVLGRRAASEAAAESLCQRGSLFEMPRALRFTAWC